MQDTYLTKFTKDNGARKTETGKGRMRTCQKNDSSCFTETYRSTWPEMPRVLQENMEMEVINGSLAKADDRRGSVVEKPLNLDDVLVNELGQFGRYQMLNLLLVSAPIMMSAFLNEYIFSAAAIPHRCQIPECGETTKSPVFNPEWIPNAIPSADNANGFASCSRYQPIGGSNGSLDYCPAHFFNQNQQDCTGFVYARENSVVFDFNLGCQDWLRALAGTLNSVGTLLVLPFTGYISDRFGRRVALVISITNLALFGVIRAFSVNYPMYLALQLLQTTFGAGTFSSSYIFATEFVGPKYRVLAGASCSSMYALGQVILGGIAWLVKPWRYMVLAIHIPCFLIIAYYWILSESVRWLLSQKKYDRARTVLLRVAKRNRTQISERSMNALCNPPKQVIEESDVPNLFTAIFSSRVLMRRICTIPIWWITAAFVYTGLSINATSLSDTMYLNYILTCAVEIPGFFTAVLVLDRIGRKPTLSGGFLFSAACNFSFAFISNNLSTLKLIVYLMGKCSISMVFTSLYLYTLELYPTQYRHRLLAFSAMIGRSGAVISPLTPALKAYWDGIPSVMFGAMGILSGILVITQPETLGSRMPDTLEEAEALGSPEMKLKKTEHNTVLKQ